MKISDEIKNKIKIINLEKFRGRPCTEEEKKLEMQRTEMDKFIHDQEEHFMTKEEMNNIIKQEELDKYLRLKLNTYDCPNQQYAVINKIKNYYTLLTLGERGGVTVNEVYDSLEKLYYGIIEEMRYAKEWYMNTGFKPFEEGGNPFEGDVEFIDWCDLDSQNKNEEEEER